MSVGTNIQTINFNKPVQQNAQMTFRSQTLPVKDYPQDTVEINGKKKGLQKGAKVAIGAGIVTGLVVGAEFLFCKGKHVKNLLGKLKGNKVKPEVKPEVIPEAIKPEYIAPKEFNPADYVSADKIPGERFGKSNVNIKQYDKQGYCVRIINVPDQVHVDMVTEFKPGSAVEPLRTLNYRKDGKTLESLNEYSSGEIAKTTYYKEDGKTIDSISDNVSNIKFSYKYKNDGVTIDSVLKYKRGSAFPYEIMQYENGKFVREISCDELGRQI